MKIILINITAKSGSTGKIVNDLSQELKERGHDIKIIYAHTEKINEPNYYQVSRPLEAKITSQICKLGRAVYKGNPLSIRRIKHIINETNPDIVHIHCINGFMCNIFKLFDFLAEKNIKTVVTHHAEFFYTGSCPYSFECKEFIVNECRNCPRLRYSAFSRIFPNTHYNWKKMHSSINKFKKENLRFVSVSPWVHERSTLSPIVNAYSDTVIKNGIDTTVFTFRNDRETLKMGSELKRISTKIILHVTSHFSVNPSSGIKGGYLIVDLAKRFPEYTFIIVSSVVSDISDLPSNVMIWGRAKSQIELSQLYSISDVTVITSKKESFSMVVAESLCCGTPVVGFKAGGPESIALKGYCNFCDYGNLDLLSDTIKSVLSNSINKSYISKISKLIFSKEIMCNRYLDLYKELLENK